MIGQQDIHTSSQHPTKHQDGIKKLTTSEYLNTITHPNQSRVEPQSIQKRPFRHVQFPHIHSKAIIADFQPKPSRTSIHILNTHFEKGR
jgi:hypothetical protein